MASQRFYAIVAGAGPGTGESARRLDRLLNSALTTFRSSGGNEVLQSLSRCVDVPKAREL